MKIMSSGSGVFFIQKVCGALPSNTKSMPASAPRSLRNMSPRLRRSGVSATSTVTGTSPRAVCSTTRGSLAHAEPESAASTAHASKSLENLVFVAAIKLASGYPIH